MTKADLIETKELLDQNGITFDPNFLQRVNDNWLTKEFPQHFEGAEGDVKVIAFLRLAYKKGFETGLADQIARVVATTIMQNN